MPRDLFFFFFFKYRHTPSSGRRVGVLLDRLHKPCENSDLVAARTTDGNWHPMQYCFGGTKGGFPVGNVDGNVELAQLRFSFRLRRDGVVVGPVRADADRPEPQTLRTERPEQSVAAGGAREVICRQMFDGPSAPKEVVE